MKLVLLIFMLLLPSVSAQEGGNLQLITIVPLILIITAVAIFLILYIKDNYKKILLYFKKIKIKKYEPKIEKLNFLDEITLFESNLNKLEIEEAFKQFCGVVKDYFAQKLNLMYEFTFEELEKKLIKKNKSLTPFIQKLSYLKYGGADLTKEQLLSLIEEFKGMLQEKPHKIKVEPVKSYLKYKILINKFKSIKPKIPAYKFVPNIYIEKKDLAFFNKLAFPIIKIKKIIQTIKSIKKTDLIGKYIDIATKCLNKKEIRNAEKYYSNALSLYYQLPIEKEKNTNLGLRLAKLYDNLEEAKNNLYIEDIDKLIKERPVMKIPKLKPIKQVQRVTKNITTLLKQEKELSGKLNKVVYTDKLEITPVKQTVRPEITHYKRNFKVPDYLIKQEDKLFKKLSELTS